MISTHTPAWGVTRWRDRRFTVAFNFNSHARVGRDLVSTDNTPASSAISTHTPAWGVTSYVVALGASPEISTHTPAWGVTRCGQRQLLRQAYFNSHARVGRDIGTLCPNHPHTISTHTPAWGVTGKGRRVLLPVPAISTHTPAWGVTRLAKCSAPESVFQLTRPRGA